MAQYLRAAALERGLRAALPDFAVRALDEALAGREPFGCVVAAPNRFRGTLAALFYLRLQTGQATREVFREVLDHAWGHDHRHVVEAAGSQVRLRAMFRAARFPLPDGLPDTVQIWRGTTALPLAEARRGLSWTLSRPVACWFAMRFANINGGPLVLSATVSRDALLHYSDEREEREVVCFDAVNAVVDGAPEDWAAVACAQNPDDALLQATLAYRNRFGCDVWSWTMDAQRIPLLCTALREAMRRGVPLSADEAKAITGTSPPPPGTLA